jgi:carbonic anhydrase
MWQAKELRFHTPSEHTIGDKSYDMEMQIFAEDANGRSLYC